MYDKSFACGEMAAECVWLSVGGFGQMGGGWGYPATPHTGEAVRGADVDRGETKED